MKNAAFVLVMPVDICVTFNLTLIKKNYETTNVLRRLELRWNINADTKFYQIKDNLKPEITKFFEIQHDIIDLDLHIEDEKLNVSFSDLDFVADYYRELNNNKIHFEFKLKKHFIEQQIKINVFGKDRSITFCVDPRYTIEKLKEEIELDTAISKNEQKLTQYNIRGDKLELENDSLIHDISKLRLAYNFGMNLFFKDLCGRTRTLYIQSMATIGDMKKQLKTDLDINSNAGFHFIFAGKDISNNNSLTLDDYDISPESTIHMTLRIRGGMYHQTSGRDGFDTISILSGPALIDDLNNLHIFSNKYLHYETIDSRSSNVQLKILKRCHHLLKILSQFPDCESIKAIIDSFENTKNTCKRQKIEN